VRADGLHVNAAFDRMSDGDDSRIGGQDAWTPIVGAAAARVVQAHGACADEDDEFLWKGRFCV